MTELVSAQPAFALRRLQGVGSYALAMYFVRIVGLLKSFLLSWYLGPSAFGLVAAFLTFLAYSAYLDFGLCNAVFRELPMLRGAGKTDRIGRLVDTAFGGSLLLGLGGAILLAVFSGLEAVGVAPGPWWLGLGLALGLFAQLLAGVPYNVGLGEGHFPQVGRSLAIAATVDLAASVGAGFAWGPKGAVLLGSLGLVVQFVLVRGLIDAKPRFHWDAREARRLASIGIPIAVIWFSNANFIMIDKVVALVGLGKASLGLYALATAASSLAMVGPVAVATRVGPRVFERIGASSEGQPALAAARAGTNLAAKVSGLLLVAGVLTLPAVTRALLPDYAPAARAAQILLAGGAILASTFPLTTYLIGRGMQWRVVRVYGVAAALNLILDVIFLRLGYGITGIAAGSLISYVLFSLAVQKTVATLDQTPRALSRIASAFAPLVLASLAGALGAVLLNVF